MTWVSWSSSKAWPSGGAGYEHAAWPSGGVVGIPGPRPCNHMGLLHGMCYVTALSHTVAVEDVPDPGTTSSASERGSAR